MLRNMHAKPQMEIDLDRWIREKNSKDDPCNKRKGDNALQLEAISSSENGDEVLETITSSENGEETGEYEVISSPEFECDLSSPSKEMKQEDEEVLAEEMEKELRDINSAEKAIEKKRKEEAGILEDELDDIELEDIELDDIELGDLDENNLGDDELDEDKEAVERANEDVDEQIGETRRSEWELSEEECEFKEVDVWEDDNISLQSEPVSPQTETLSLETEVVSPGCEVVSPGCEVVSPWL